MRPGLVGLILALALAAPAAAVETVTTIPGAPGPGPSKYDKAYVTKFGPKSADRVLILMPGFQGGAGDFTLDAREIVKRVPGLQVWAVDRRSQALEDTSRFLGLKLPWAAGVFSEVGGIATLEEPTAPAIAQAFPLLPAQFKPPIPATNRGLFGYAFDASTSPKALALIHVQAGSLGANGDWVDGEVTPIERLAQTFGQEPANATEWYFPARLSIDVDAANALTRNAQTDALKLRPWHRREVDLPLYALQTDLTGGRVLRGARRFIAGSKVPRARSVLVDTSSDESHLDPLTAAPARNEFLQTVVPFLRKLRRSAP